MKRRAITLWPEWAAAIAWLDKRVENRTWRPNVPDLGPGGWVCIHAGSTVGGLPKMPKGHEAQQAHREARQEALWAVLETARRAGWRWTHDERLDADELSGDLAQLVEIQHDLHGTAPAVQLVLPTYSAIVAVARVVGVDREARTGWDAEEQHHWRLADVRRLVEPVPCAGARGLWEVEPATAELVRQRIPT